MIVLPVFSILSMLCLACSTGALRCFSTSTEIANTCGLRTRNLRYMTTKISRRLFQSDPITLRDQPAGTGKIRTLSLLRVSSLRPTHSLVVKSRQKKELFHSDRNWFQVRADFSTTTSKYGERVSHPAKIKSALDGSKRDSIRLKGSIKSGPSLRNGASVDRALRGNIRNLDDRGNSTFGEPRKSVRVKDTGSYITERASLRVYSSKRTEGCHGAMRSSRSTKTSTDFQNDTQNYKDQPWQTQKKALSKKFGPTGWLPRKRLSPDTLEGIRALHTQYPDRFTTPILADQFKVSPEAIRRILKSKWIPKDEEVETRRRRWEKRGENIWSQMVEMGIKPPKKWRQMGVGKSSESKPSQSNRFEPQMKSSSISSHLRSQPNTNLHTISAKGDEIGSPVLLADRIL